MPVQDTDHRIVLKHPKGATAEILLYGATVISWKASTQSNEEVAERLFVSSKAALDGTKPVRGGIPIVFPCFGPPSHPEHARLKQHGFARSQVWTFEGVVADDESRVSVRLRLEPTASIKAVYDRPFGLGYVVTLWEHALGTELHVTSEEHLEFQALLHNYIRAPADQVLVYELENKWYYDKTEDSERGRNTAKRERRAGVDVRKATDSVYEDAGERQALKWPGGGMEIGVRGFKDVVVWNPQKEVGDMEEGGWERFVCVEPGYVRGYAGVLPGATWIGGQVLSV